MFQALISTVLVIASFVGGFFGGAKMSEVTQPKIVQAPQQMNVGAALPGGENTFETSLQSAISSSATSMTLTANSLRGGGTLSGFDCFTIDEGTASREDVCGTVSGTTVSSLTRGLSPSTATTTIASLQFAHRRGANVKKTDFPLIQIIRNQANGSDTYNNPLVYTSHPTFTSTTQLIDKKYADDLALAGVPVCSESTNGACRLATKLQQASSTPTTANTPYVIQAQNATSTYNAGAAGGNGLNVVVTRNNNTIDPNFIDQSSSASYSFSSTTVVAGGFLSPTGSVTAYATNTPPTGWLLADGTSYLRTTYPALYAIIGVAYGSADGTHFNVPDLRGRNVLMASTTANMAQSGGESNNLQTGAEAGTSAHTHTMAGFSISGSGNFAGGGGNSGSTGTLTTNASSLANASQAMNVLDPYLVLQYIIKY